MTSYSRCFTKRDSTGTLSKITERSGHEDEYATFLIRMEITVVFVPVRAPHPAYQLFHHSLRVPEDNMSGQT